MDTSTAVEKIRQRAYEIYQIRGRLPGRDQEDWFQAEREVMQSTDVSQPRNHESPWPEGLQVDGEVDGTNGREPTGRRPAETSRRVRGS